MAERGCRECSPSGHLDVTEWSLSGQEHARRDYFLQTLNQDEIGRISQGNGREQTYKGHSSLVQ